MFPRPSYLRSALLACIGLAAVLMLLVPSALALVTATGVALNPGANCANASPNITLTTDGATNTEYGLTTNGAGTSLYQFQHGTALTNFSGTYFGYFMPTGTLQAEGTLIGSYAWVGQDPPNPATTGEFFVAYECSSTGANDVLYTCAGPYGSCPKTAQEYLSWNPVDEPGCNALIPIPAQAVDGQFVSDAVVYWGPDESNTTTNVVEAGKSYLVTGQDASGAFRQIILNCSFVWVKTGTVGPNPDAVWQNRPLPTTVIN